MKKLLYITFAALLVVASFSPARIVLNSKGSDGERTVLTSDKLSSSDNF